MYLFSLKINSILKASTRQNKWITVYKQFPTVPKMERDINFIFNKKYLVSEIISQIKKSGKKLLEDVNLIDVYDDDSFGKELISYTFRLSYRDSEKTLFEAKRIFHKKTDKAIVCYGMADDFTRAMPDEFKYDDSIDTFTAYKMYVSSKPWVSDNYLRKPERKPEWV